MTFLKRIARRIKGITLVTKLEISQINQGGILRGKKILITGGSSGIGLAMVKKFLSEGATVLITGRDVSKLNNVLSDINNDHLYSLVWDVANVSILHERMTEVVEMLKGLDVVVNNAAFLDHKHTDEAFYDKTLNTNLKAVYYICKEAGHRFQVLNGEKGGKILNISSINGYMCSTHPYYISKWGVNGLTKGFAKEFAPYNIIVNAIAPGYCASSINYQDVSKNAYDSRTLIHRIIVPEDIAELATFLISDAANAIVGQIITVDGGTLL